jgi:hypothetical protein
MDQGAWFGYSWTKPRGWYNRIYANTNFYYSRLVTPIDLQRPKDMMFQNAGGNINVNAQTKKLWQVGMNIHFNTQYNDFYEPRVFGRVFQNKGNIGTSWFWESNSSKKLSWGGSFFTGMGGVFKRTSFDYAFFGKIRFSSKFSVDHSVSLENAWNQPGWAYTKYSGLGALNDTIIFSRRDLHTVENVLNFKYNFTNKMGLTLRARHYFSKVDPQQFYELNKYGNLGALTTPFNQNVRQNYNFFSVDMLYTWQFAQGSFINIAWKDLAETFNREFEKTYFKNLDNTISGPQSNSISIRVIYFLDYLTAKQKLHKKV